MKRIFISSVMNNYSNYRNAAKNAINLLAHRPIMAENFSSRPYNSETACISEVLNSHVFALILGENYGFVDESDLSVTQSEFRAALGAKKPILAFIQDCDMEPEQLAFKKEVEDYKLGFFRSKFNTPEELKDQIIRAVRNWEAEQNAPSESDFQARIKDILPRDRYSSISDSNCFVAFWGQPKTEIDLFEVEKSADEYFQKLCKIGVASLRDGYELHSKAHFTELQSKEALLQIHDDGLITLTFSAQRKTDDSFSFNYFYVSPQIFESIIKASEILNSAHISWVLVGLFNMESKYFAEPPKGSSSSVPMFNEKFKYFVNLFNPYSESAFNSWVESQIKKLKRIYGNKN